MDIFFDVISGPQQGEKFDVQAGFEIGRKAADITIKDSKLSSKHAYIEEDKRGNLVLIDNDSHNGIYVNSKRVKKALLLPGIVIQLGQNTLKVQEKDVDAMALLFNQKQKSLLEDAFLHGQVSVFNKKKTLQSFVSPLTLTFIQGIQCDLVWHIGYGPRHFGRFYPEFPLHEPNCPDECFILKPNKLKVEFETPCPEKVLLNNQQKLADEVVQGDLISIGKTLIRIDF